MGFRKGVWATLLAFCGDGGAGWALGAWAGCDLSEAVGMHGVAGDNLLCRDSVTLFCPLGANGISGRRRS